MEIHYRATVKRCEPEEDGSDVCLLELELSEGAAFSALPGQFIVLEPMSSRSVMPRPFSVVEIEANVISVLIKVVGENSEIYSGLKPGERIFFAGPHGTPIPIEKNVENYILVGGGIGGAALVVLARELARRGKSCKVVLGGKTRSQIAGVNFFRKYGIEASLITEAGKGRTGFVTDLLEEVLAGDDGGSVVVSCGPKLMLERVAGICKKHGNICLVMLEEVMACGMGSCKGCAVFGKDGSVKHVCTDGPAIDASWVDWQKLIPKSGVYVSEFGKSRKIDMTVRLGDFELDYPTMNSSGCLAVNALEEGHFDISKLGALVTKGVTVMCKEGNAMPRTCETPAGMINSIGLENIGLDKFVRTELPRWLAFGKPVFVNISGFAIDDYVALAKAVDKTDSAGIEVNISCPNVKGGGIAFGTDPQLANAVIKAVRQATSKHVIVKLTPNVIDIVSIAKACVAGGADSISLINTLQAMAIDPLTRRPKIGTIMGGLSGPAIRPVAVRMIHQLYQAGLGVPIIGMGGIEDGRSGAEFFIAGADLIAVGTGGFGNRRIFTRINDDLESLIRYHGFTSINQLVGSLVY